MRKPGLLWFLAVLALAGQPAATVKPDETLVGAALQGARLYAWGGSLYQWDTRTWKQRRIARSSSSFGEGGCVNTRGSVLLQDGADGGPLVLISPGGVRTVWDRRVDMHDCLFTTLFGRAGALVTNHYGQVRFYEGPERYRELYSFYTASRQAGLLMKDVDGDGREDIFAGNYWIRSPEAFDLSWRLFAVNLRFETPDSATMSLALYGDELYAAQGHMNPGSVFRYRPRRDRTQLWDEQEAGRGLRYPHAIATGAFGVLVAENDGAGSGVFVTVDGERLESIGRTEGAHSAFVLGSGRVALIGARSITLWNVQRRR